MSLTSDPHDPRLTKGTDASPTEQAEAYLVLPEEERAKGFIRPVRYSYVHRGIKPKHATRPLTSEEGRRHADLGYLLYEMYPESESSKKGRFWTQAEIDSGCGVLTFMAEALAETYARKPDFYGATWCMGCKKHLPVAEFVWDGTTDVVGS